MNILNQPKKSIYIKKMEKMNILDQPFKKTFKRKFDPIQKKIELIDTLPKPLKPMKYIPPKPKPTPKPRKEIKAPAPLPRKKTVSRIKETIVQDPRVKKLIDEIKPYYSPWAIQEFKKKLRIPQRQNLEQRKLPQGQR